MNRYIKIAAVAALGSIALAGCANQPYSGNTYSGAQAQTAQSVSYGTITGIRPVTIQDDSSGFGGIGGAVLGGLLGNQVGGGSGRTIATAVGAIGGAVAGNRVEGSMDRTAGMEVQVQRDDGQNLVIVQQADNTYQVGQRVRLVGSGTSLRVAPY
ncbi:glycine zipper 2TM domain-containing protein [Halotalea alkalilenta]|uniref:Glycine zipper 2TM domain-containing protein n=1 Tax=Halotalea alkalilenta TaxID=376489 RepID=A0A172YHK0_9GAMM|nr:glycine zipper 2TM domain-containing protein [Halotalea alkalilenta]ANF58683.1 hypothetical protein A5892_15435 [Halotalea alkalilenta]